MQKSYVYAAGESFGVRVVYGFLSYDQGMVFIPNREVQNILLEWILGIGIACDQEFKTYGCIVEEI